MSGTRRPYKMWDQTDRANVLTEARRLLAADPLIPAIDLIRKAQQVLDADKQRTIGSIKAASYNWFRDGLRQQPVAQEEAQAVAAVDDFVAEKVTPQQVQLTDEFMAAVLKAVKGSDQQPIDDTVVRTLINQVADVRDRIMSLERLFVAFMEKGFQATLIPAAPLTLNLVPAGVQQVQTVPAQPAPPPANGQTPTRKPSIIILDVDSGGTKDGIKLGTKGFVEKIDWGTTEPTKYPSYDGYDYVLTFKRAPETWVKGAKQRYPTGKYFHTSGNAMQVAEFIRKLPPVK